MSGDTTSVAERGPRGDGKDVTPGLLLVFAAGRPQLAALPVSPSLVLGRDLLSGLGIDDKRLSRQHAEVVAGADRLIVRDAKSRNGTFVAGQRATGERVLLPGASLRVGDCLFIACADVEPFVTASYEFDDVVVIGPQLRAVWKTIAAAAAAGDSLHVQGETGAGKELAARHFHRESGREAGPFVAVNCATIAPTLAERLLFGAKKGTYSSADADAEGFLQAAHGGTLFLDEIAELGLEVQAKLLRAVESRSVTPLGATKARELDVRLVSATHRDLRAEAAAGRFREDLYYRIGRPSVHLPALHARREDLPWLARAMLARIDAAMKLSVGLVEQLLPRPWPGNVRELCAELTSATRLARGRGETTLEAEHLAETAGQPLAGTVPASVAEDAPEQEVARLVRALADHGGKVATTARALGLHRNQLRRLMAKHGLAAPSEDLIRAAVSARLAVRRRGARSCSSTAGSRPARRGSRRRTRAAAS